MAVWAAHSREEAAPVEENSASLAAVALMASHIVGSSPSWERLNELSRQYLETLRSPESS